MCVPRAANLRRLVVAVIVEDDRVYLPAFEIRVVELCRCIGGSYAPALITSWS
jgi:hypothetical protein